MTDQNVESPVLNGSLSTGETLLDLKRQFIGDIQRTVGLEAKVDQLQEDLSRARELADSGRVERGRLKRRLARAEKKRESERRRADQLQAERDRLRAELDAVHASTTWRVGSTFVRPAAALRDRRRRSR